VLCRAGNQLGVWDRLTKNSLKQAFCWRGKTYVVLDQTGHGITWTDLFRLDPGKLIWISGHCLTEDPALDAEKPEFLFQQNNKAYLAD
ncbi:MAG: hypothetical protein ACREL1_07255, partial [bacterium]